MSTMVFDQLYNSVDESLLMGHLSEFARWEKLSGSSDELKNVAYIKAQLDRIGYKTELITHDAYISLPRDAKVTINGRSFRCITHSFSRSSGDHGITAPLVYLGRGLEADYAGKDVSGCIVVLDGLAAPPAAKRASRSGAIGQLHVSPHQHIHEMCISPVWGNPSHETLDELPTTVVCSIDHADGDLVKNLIAQGDTSATLHATVETGWRKTPILIGELPADNADDDTFVLLSGHQDTWYHGVMDNGSANAAMIEVARVCAGERKAWRRGLRIAFWSGHSHGRYSGSAWYVDEHWGELERRCVAHINVDSLGGTGNSVLADAPAAAELLHLAQEGVTRATGETLTGQRLSRAGDESFWGIGIPSIYMTLSHEPLGKDVNVIAAFMGEGKKRAGGAMGWWWHTPDDTIDKIDPALLVRDTKVYFDTTWRLLSDAVLPFDHRAQVGQLVKIIEHLQASVGSRFDLSALREQTAVLRTRVASLHEVARTASVAGRVEAVNKVLVALSRVLTPLEYTNGDRFVHDPALGQTQFPALDGVRRLSGLEPGSDAEKFAVVAARRGRNRLIYGINQSIALLDESLPQLEAREALLHWMGPSG